jgi:MFS family permease
VALALGAGYGGINALAPAVLANFFGRERLGAAMGALYTSGSVGALLGAPLAGLIIGGAGRYQTATWVFFGVALLSVLALLPLRSEVKPGG